MISPKAACALAVLSAGCVDKSDYTFIPEEFTTIDPSQTADSGEDVPIEPDFNRECGQLAYDDAQLINNPEAGEALIPEVYARHINCADGDTSLDCTYEQHGTLYAEDGFSINTTTSFEIEEFYKAYLSVGGTLDVDIMLGFFGFEGGVSTDSYLEVTARHISQSNLEHTDDVLSASEAYDDEHGVSGLQMGFIDQVKIDAWTAREFRRVESQAEIDAVGGAGVYEIDGSYYIEIAQEYTGYAVYLCLEPIH